MNSIRNSFLLLFLTAVISSTCAESIFTLNLGERYRLIERQNLRVRENGRYKGFLYREFRAFLRSSDGSERRYTGEYYILENMKRNALLVAKAVDQEYETAFSINLQGNVLVEDKFKVPIHQNFPAFSPNPVRQGESWDVSGSDLISDSKGNSVRIPFLCHYILRGTGRYMNRPVTVIDAQYALRYQKSGYKHESDKIKKISGTRKAVIMIYDDSTGGIFIKSDIKQQIIYTDGDNEETEGFILTWYNGVSGSALEVSDLQITENIEKLKKDVSSDSGSVGMLDDVTVEKSEKGLVLKIQNIHFLPDSPIILPEEKTRLDSIADLLKTVKNRMFLITGHTADVGSKESQDLLSVERAKTIVDELVKRDLSPKLFMYQGKGGKEPVASNDTKEGRAKNRRVEITILY